MSDEARPIGGRIFTPTFLICLVVVGIAAYFGVKRFVYGLGAVSNMNDG